MGLLERVSAARASKVERRFGVDQWLTDFLMPSLYQSFPLIQSWPVAGRRATEIASTLPAYAQALRGCPPAFAAQMVRALVLSQARFTFRNTRASSSPRKLFGTRELALLERPWRNATTGELIARMEWHAGLAGNAFVTRRPDRLRVLRPDWVAVVYGSEQTPDEALHALDGEVIGYAYCNGGFGSGADPVTILPDAMTHWSPLPDPESPGMGMSWLTPAIRDIQGDKAATEHKLTFFANGATANMVVTGLNAPNEDEFNRIVDMLEGRHTGLANAYRTLYLTMGADAKVVGSDLKQMDFKATQGAGETRIAFLSRVPAPLLGISEGLAGSSLNAGNFGMARRMFADTWVYPTLQDLAAALAPLVNVPPDAELWTDTLDMPLLREDGKDAAEITQINAVTIRQLIEAGCEFESVIKAVKAQDMSLLKHTGLVSVQLQEPGATQPALAEA